jgi:hypothetical protein
VASIAAHGFATVRHVPLTFGVASLYHGIRA